MLKILLKMHFANFHRLAMLLQCSHYAYIMVLGNQQYFTAILKVNVLLEYSISLHSDCFITI